MTDTEKKIIEYFKDNPGVHSFKDLSKKGAYSSLIKKMVTEKTLKEISRGYYRLNDEEYGQYEDFENISAIVPEAVFCLFSALDFHEIGTQRAFDFHIALPGGKRKPGREEFNIIPYYFSDVSYHSGIEDHGRFKVYSAAKTVADCFKFRNKIGLDVAIEAMKSVIRSKKATIAQIIKHSEACRVKNVIIPYLEAM